MALQQGYLEQDNIETIYLGGGTPSLLAIEEIRRLLDCINETFSVIADAEITLEANPDDITDEKLSGWKNSGINRLSIGVQSFFEEDLRWMNRAHTADQAIRNLQQALDHFENITIDLIYGTPGLTNNKWRQNIETALSLGIPHLSCYALTVEPKTPLDKMINQHKAENINPDQQSEQFLLLMQWLNEAGYEHYEISNFAKPGWRSRHNSSYWQGKKYLGLGPSAHSYDGMNRQWNISNNQQYIRSITSGTVPFETETLSPTQRLNEYIMTAIRTSEGINVEVIDSLYKADPGEFLSRANKFILSGKIIKVEGQLRLTNEGKLLADGIAADLFY